MIETFLPILAMVVGSFMAASGIPQIYRIIKRKSSEDVSIKTYLILLIGGIVWIIYGIYLSNYALYISNSIGVIVVSTTLITIVKYRKPK
ncbi:MAG: hypothetical protein JSW73_01380 [Candidatus Woesearchaeota archaeon]|nr:MAG: hypothetical protein JSW73_01380 [Candidatus Woesearchaeota archaeon]